MQALLQENEKLRRLSQEGQAALDRLNHEQKLVNQNLERRSRESDYGRIRGEYERRRSDGALQPSDEVALLKQQLKALENDANRVAVAEAKAQVGLNYVHD